MSRVLTSPPATCSKISVNRAVENAPKSETPTSPFRRAVSCEIQGSSCSRSEKSQFTHLPSKINSYSCNNEEDEEDEEDNCGKSNHHYYMHNASRYLYSNRNSQLSASLLPYFYYDYTKKPNTSSNPTAKTPRSRDKTFNVVFSRSGIDGLYGIKSTRAAYVRSVPRQRHVSMVAVPFLENRQMDPIPLWKHHSPEPKITSSSRKFNRRDATMPDGWAIIDDFGKNRGTDKKNF
mmetsp:Transcript_24134/g.43171  ORF Transcript_24134/g.43171 Transcript_24134/m.43171 type:complete len:234 (+) Transcript_24134:1346-2047(+)